MIVPLAGKGTRLLPLTKRVPKPLVKVAGRPVMDYVMDTVRGLDVEELIVITGHLKDVVERYIVKNYKVEAKFVEQKTLDGTAGAINLARPYVDGPVMIIFVDTLFDADLSIEEHERRRDPVGQGGRGLSALRRHRDRRARLHDAHRREALHADLEARQHRALLHQGLEDPVRRHYRGDALGAGEGSSSP